MPVDQTREKTYSVYCHTTPNGKKYVGITCRPPEERWELGSGYKTQVFGRAVEKYGWDNIKHEILFENLSLEDAEKKEQELISQWNTTDRRFGYNQTTGGSAYRFNEETKKKISKALTGRKLSDEHREHIAQCRTGWYFSEEVRKKMSENRSGIYPSEETRKRLRDAHQWQAKSVAQISLDGDIVAIFQSIGDAARSVGCAKVLIRKVCQGKQKQTAGYKWAFL